MTPERVEAYIEAITTSIAARARYASRRLGMRSQRSCTRRTVLPPSSLHRTHFLYPHAEPHPDEWLRALRCDTAIHKPASAPHDFTARVMARVSAPEPRDLSAARIAGWAEDTAMAARRAALERAGIVAGVVASVVASAAALALIAGCVVTILAPRAVLAFLGTMLTFAVAGLTGARALLALMLSVTSNDGLMLALAALPIGAMIIGSRLVRQSPDTLRRA